MELTDGRLVYGSPKNHQQRSVPFPSFLSDQLRALIATKGSGDLLFTSPYGRPLRVNNWKRKAFDKAADTLADNHTDLLRPTVHDLRHTAASLAISAGANVKAVQRMLGHASAAMTLDVYADLFDDDLDAVGDALSRLGSPEVVGKRGQIQILRLRERLGMPLHPNDLLGGPGGARTHDPRIKSPMLCQLSYRPIRF